VIFQQTAIPGAYIIESEPVYDARGSFGRWFDCEQFGGHGLLTRFDQDSFAANRRAGTLRGLHLQAAPQGETKLVVCVSGAAFDVVVDLRPGPTFGRHFSLELSAENWRSVYIPSGCAHGYQTTADATTLLYRIAGRYEPAATRGVRWDDPNLAIAWPLGVTELSERDAQLPSLSLYADAECAF
jgi:dTDP-4-dehydrorhamnose 3,5-epimerase